MAKGRRTPNRPSPDAPRTTARAATDTSRRGGGRAASRRQDVPDKLQTPTDLKENSTNVIVEKLNGVLADTFALYLKTKNFHWHVSGPHFRDYHRMLDKQSQQLISTTDDIAERVRKISGTTLRSIGHISQLQRLEDNDESFVPPQEMLRELIDDNKALVGFLRDAHEACDDGEDFATASLIENWIDAAEKRVWFLFETTRTEETG